MRRSPEWLESISQDIRFGLRGLRSRPGFAITVLLTLALGVGANTAIFSVVDAVLLRPLPFAQPDRLVHLWETFESKVDNRSEASYPDYLDWRARNTGFTDLAGYQGGGFLLGGSQPMTLTGAKSTANFFDVLGVRPIVGRSFVAGEDAPGAPKVVLLSFGFWQRHFGGDSDVVGRSQTHGGASTTIIGVQPEGFHFAPQGDAEIWVPIDRSAAARQNRGNHWLNVIGRLKPGVTASVANTNMSAIMRELANAYPGSNAGRDAAVIPLQDEFVGSVRPILRLLYSAVVVVLLVACVNVANLLLMRGADREREIAVRIALGANSGRVMRQLLTESVMLAVCGGLLGLAVAQVGVHSLLGLLPSTQIRGLPTLTSAGLDGRVVTYALLVSLATGIGFGIVPAFRLSKSQLHDTLKSSTRGTTSGASRLRDSLVVAEVALTVILMSGALLFGRSLLRLLAVDPGFRVEHVVTGSVVLPPTTYTDPASRAAAFSRFVDRLRETPGVETVGLTSRMPLNWGNSMGFTIKGQPAPNPAQLPTASYRPVSTEYFHAMGIPVVRGRVFGPGDDATSPSTAVVNRAFVAAYVGNQEPIGQFIQLSTDTIRIVGVVGDVPIGSLGDKIPPTLYLSFAKFPETSMALALRTRLPLDDAARAIRQALQGIEPTAALGTVTTMEHLIAQSPSVFIRRFPLFLVGAFAATALLLAVVGIYGVVSYAVAQRSREMGIRLALGAEPRSVIALVMRHGGWMAAMGITVGVTTSILLGRFAEKMLYEIRPTDPVTYATVAVALAAVAVSATILPARRATRVDPTTALRTE
jgi:putative ABC transport system permease protein